MSMFAFNSKRRCAASMSVLLACLRTLNATWGTDVTGTELCFLPATQTPSLLRVIRCQLLFLRRFKVGHFGK